MANAPDAKVRDFISTRHYNAYVYLEKIKGHELIGTFEGKKGRLYYHFKNTPEVRRDLEEYEAAFSSRSRVPSARKAS